jgi:hypothetical protein
MIKSAQLIMQVLFFVLLTPLFVNAETPVGSNIDSRVVLAFKVDDQAAQAMIPEGWKLLTLPKGPFAGSNLLVAFIDRHLALDPEGKPVTPYSSRSMALLSYGVKAGIKGARLYVTRVYETPPVASDYGNGVQAEFSHSAAIKSWLDGTRVSKASWHIKPKTGGEISFNLSYETGMPGWKPAEATPYSSVNPDFHRIYRYEQLADLAMSNAIGRELKGEVSFQSSIPELAGMFDGSEKLVGVLSIPVYIRSVSLP